MNHRMSTSHRNPGNALLIGKAVVICEIHLRDQLNRWHVFTMSCGLSVNSSTECWVHHRERQVPLWWQKHFTVRAHTCSDDGCWAAPSVLFSSYCLPINTNSCHSEDYKGSVALAMSKLFAICPWLAQQRCHSSAHFNIRNRLARTTQFSVSWSR